MSDRLLVLVRHGQSEWNLKNLFTGWKDPDLTEQGVTEAIDAARKLKAQGVTVVLITHKLREIMAVTDRVSVMRRGTIVETVDTAATSPAQLADAMVGRRVLLTVTKGPARPGPVRLEARDITVLGHRIRYWDEGQGDPLVLVHGFSGSATYEWAPVFAPLARHRRVIALQVIGFAPSEQPDIVYSTDALVSHLGEFMRALKLENITLLGESFGGWHVAAYATRAAALGLPPIAKLVLVGGAICVKQAPPPDASGFADPQWEIASAVFAGALPPSYEATRMAILRDSGLARREPTRDELAQISVPTLLLWGEKDALIPLECGQDAAALIPNAELVVLPDVGHIPSIEAADDFIRIVGAFADR